MEKNIIEKMRENNFRWIEVEDIEELYSIYLTDDDQFNNLMASVDEYEGIEMMENFENIGAYCENEEVTEWFKRYKFMQALFEYIYPHENNELSLKCSKLFNKYYNN